MERCPHGMTPATCAECIRRSKPPAGGGIAALFEHAVRRAEAGDKSVLARTRHRWTEGDDLVTLYLFRFGEGRIGTTKGLGERLGMGAGSMRMRLGNFRALAGRGGLGNAARQSALVWERLGDLPEPELRRLVLEYLDA